MLDSTHTEIRNKKRMPDIAKEARTETPGQINWVGMGEIEAPVKIQDFEGNDFLTPARIDAFVSLDDPKAKGIHMSRPFLLIQEMFKRSTINFNLLADITRDFIESQEGISQSSHIKVNFEYMTLRKALKSPTSGWRSYPVEMYAENINGQLKFTLSTEILYSSTCPCSAALARQLIQEKFLKDFDTNQVSRADVLEWLGGTSGIVATPHSQRSRASVKVAIDTSTDKDIVELIDAIEDSVKTVVQTSVKREDEQEFARLNGQNLMFVEDSVRRIRNQLDDMNYSDYRIHVEHLESLHPHDAVATIVKGVEGGFKA